MAPSRCGVIEFLSLRGLGYFSNSKLSSPIIRIFISEKHNAKRLNDHESRRLNHLTEPRNNTDACHHEGVFAENEKSFKIIMRLQVRWIPL